MVSAEWSRIPESSTVVNTPLGSRFRPAAQSVLLCPNPPYLAAGEQLLQHGISPDFAGVAQSGLWLFCGSCTRCGGSLQQRQLAPRLQPPLGGPVQVVQLPYLPACQFDTARAPKHRGE